MNQIVLSHPVSSPVSAFYVVAIIDGFARQADPTDATQMGKVAGVSQQSVVSGKLDIVAAGEMHGYSWITGQRYYVGPNGSLSTSPTFVGARWKQSIGWAKDTNTLILELQPMILRA